MGYRRGDPGHGRTDFPLIKTLMAEVAAVRDAVKPAETLLVADAMTGQDAVTTATNFNQRIGLSGIVLTRVDGDARGGAALVHARGHRLPDQADRGRREDRRLEPFHPDRIAGRILGMGDVVSLVEKAAAGYRGRGRGEDRPQDAEGRVRLQRPAPAAAPASRRWAVSAA